MIHTATAARKKVLYEYVTNSLPQNRLSVYAVYDPEFMHLHVYVYSLQCVACNYILYGYTQAAFRSEFKRLIKLKQVPCRQFMHLIKM